MARRLRVIMGVLLSMMIFVLVDGTTWALDPCDTECRERAFHWWSFNEGGARQDGDGVSCYWCKAGQGVCA